VAANVSGDALRYDNDASGISAQHSAQASAARAQRFRVWCFAVRHRSMKEKWFSVANWAVKSEHHRVANHSMLAPIAC